MKSFIILTISSIVILLCAFGQQLNSKGIQAQHTLYLMGVPREEGIKLRFGTSRPDLIGKLHKQGLMLEKARREANKDNSQLTYEKLGIQQLAPQSAWPKPSKQDTSYLVAAYSLLFDQKATSEEDSDFKWAMLSLLSCYSWDVALHLGWGYVDAEVEPHATYVYRVYCPSDPQFDTVYYHINSKVQALVTRPVIDSVALGEKAIKLLWQKNLDTTFVAYHIEKSNQLEGPYKRLNEAPFIDFEGGDSAVYQSYDDVIDEYNQAVWYRIQAINCYGELTGYSTPVKVVLIDQSPPLPPTHVEINFPAKGGTSISWDYPYPIEKGLHFSILQGREGQKLQDYQTINAGEIAADQRSFAMPDIPATGAYFVVLAADSLGNASLTLPVFAAAIDSMPPLPPQQLMGKSDTSGHIKISWLPNTEKDLKGYRIFMANDTSHTFSQLSDTVFESTTFDYSVQLNSLSEDIFFKLVAVDLHNNHSGFSAVLHVKLPDTIPPAPAIFNEYLVTREGIKLYFYPSFDLDVASVALLRKNMRNGKVDTLLLIAGPFTERKSNHFMDKTAEAGEAYVYSLLTVDDDANKAISPINLSLSMIYQDEVRTVSDVKQQISNKGVEVSWEPVSDSIAFYIILRKKDGEGFITYKRLQADQNSFYDSLIEQNHYYQYGILAEDHQGRRSKLVKGKRIFVN